MAGRPTPLVFLSAASEGRGGKNARQISVRNSPESFFLPPMDGVAAMQIVTVFERIPDIFVTFYDKQFADWAKRFRTVGSRAVIRFDRPMSPPALAADQRRIVGVVVTVHRDGNRVVIRPASDGDAEAIRRHARELEARLN